MPVTTKPLRPMAQLTLFQPPHAEGLWEACPLENRHQVKHLLARMLREHAVRRLGEPAAREAGDE